MTEEEFQKKLKGTKLFCIVIAILMLISIFINLKNGNNKNAIFALIMVIWLILFYTLTKKKNIVGPILGIILAILYFIQFFIQFNIISVIFGICIFVDCIAMIKYIKQIK